MLRCTCLLFTFIFLNCISCFAQFSDTIDYYISTNLAGNINKTAAGTNYLFNNGAKFSIQKDRLAFNTNNNWLYGENSGKLISNDFISSTDFNLYYSPQSRFNYWGLANYTSSFSLKINSQFQGGAGVAYKLISSELMMLRLSDGLLFESSNIVLNDSVNKTYNTIRNSLRLQFRYKFKKLLSFESAAFWQPSITYTNDYIININAGLNVKLLHWLSFTSKINYINISRTQRENMLITYGIVMEKYF